MVYRQISIMKYAPCWKRFAAVQCYLWFSRCLVVFFFQAVFYWGYRLCDMLKNARLWERRKFLMKKKILSNGHWNTVLGWTYGISGFLPRWPHRPTTTTPCVLQEVPLAMPWAGIETSNDFISIGKCEKKWHDRTYPWQSKLAHDASTFPWLWTAVFHCWRPCEPREGIELKLSLVPHWWW